ncbi:MAG TPA: glycine betaine ABC transporter substrate-binding protein [Solirubrobacteraceae bacterium]|jgi:osmoprotectant transport system substrate-binding protein|nr:glycine betaine ABC transporter substrate-binding protein [Solirubrobacteraceae bacterium]
MRAAPQRLLIVVILVALVPLAAGCGSSSKKTSGTGAPAASGPGTSRPPVTLGDKNFAEEFVLGQLYTQALQAKGYKVTLKENIGSTEITDKALTSGQIDGYPEYTGTIVSELAHRNSRPPTAAATYSQAKAFENARGFTLLKFTPFIDTDALATKPAYASQHGLHTVADLKKVSGATLGAPPEFQTRAQGLPGLKRVYGITSANLSFKPLTIGLQYQALDGGQVQVADVFTTDGQLSRGSYAVLKDPKNLFGFQNAAMVIAKKVLAREGPAFAATIDAVTAKLTTPAIQTMNAAVVIDKQSPAAVARTFLQANALL